MNLKKRIKGKYVLNGNSLIIKTENDTFSLNKSKHNTALDHIVNSQGLKIDLPTAKSTRWPDLQVI